ncbi:MAG: hypothetical protein MJ120_05540 [Clostridia bacterium]|nr:hypothetical protein [Clostridia bacterium]
MKISKKILSVIIAVVLVALTCTVAFAKEKCTCGNTPVVMVSGFGATTLVRVNDNGSEEIVFPPTLDVIKSAVTDNLNKIDKDAPLEFPASVVTQILDPIRTNPDGSSYYNLKPIYSSVEDTSLEGFRKNDALKYVPYTGSKFLDMECIGEKIGDDHVFNFLFDWRIPSDDVADQLLKYIEDVLKYTGHDKVSIYCLSQGSVCVAQYLYKYADKEYIDNVVFNDPILEGSDFITDIVSGRTGYKLTYGEIIKLVENILHTEIDVSALASIIPGGIDNIVEMGATLIVIPMVKNSPAYLEMVTKKDYENVLKTYYNEEGNEKLIEKVNKTRNGFMADIEGTLRNAQKHGADVSIVSSSGKALVTGTGVNSDSIVNTEYSCGAYCAPWGETFPADYVQKKDIGHDCISPDRTVDLSCGYLPEKTWIINDLFHGMVEWAPNSLALVEKLLYTHDLKDAWSSKEFPQFMQSDDPTQNVQAVFADSNSLGTKTGGNGKILVKNVSSEDILINSISVDGNKSGLPFVLKSGESTAVAVDASKAHYGTVSVSYSKVAGMGKETVKDFGYSVKDNYSGVVVNHDKDENTTSALNKVFGVIWHFFNRAIRYIADLFGTLISQIKGA